ncbi:MAG: 50S ribosomal protein L25 [Coriobacteriia bacterium]|nr:50S ribosomal protein L25 [Coriobacteriia bacterium]
MAESIDLNATAREVIGKANRRLPHERLPAVLYGVGHESTAISVDKHVFGLLLHKEGLMSSLVKLTVDENKPVNVIVKSLQHDPLKGTVTHVDFWAVNMKQMVATSVPVHFLGESPGVKTGGVMMHNIQTVHVESLPTEMPEYLEADVSALEIGDSLHISDIVALDGVTILDAADEILCSVVAPKAEEVEEEIATEAVEPEVIGEKSEE